MKRNYGISQQTDIQSEIEGWAEAVRLQGFVVIENVIPLLEAKKLGKKLDLIYTDQANEFGAEKLAEIQEEDVARCPLAYDTNFLKLANHKAIRDLVGNLVGEYHILHLQNGIINRPQKIHHQTSWHRDLPYQNWTSSSPLAISVLWCLDDFSRENGGTILIPGSHKMESLPSDLFIEKEGKVIEAPAGSVVVFDSMVFHRAGENKSDTIRRGVNHVYSIPLIKQQIDIPELMQDRFDPVSEMGKFLGYDSQVPKSVKAFRKRRESKLT